MKINLFTTQMGPNVSRYPGIQEVPDAEAQDLIDAGYAEEAPDAPSTPEGEPPAPTPAPASASEHATTGPREFATLPRPRPSRKHAD